MANNEKIPVGVLGATGSVGQKFIELLSNHPWFRVAEVAASERSAGKKYKDAANWILSTPLPKDVAEMTGLDISTVSRVANSKFVQTHFGIFPLKFFFSEGLQTDSGEEVSTREIKRILQDCIENEQKRRPLTDESLTDILQEKGYQIARRTVAKYREQLNIPVARLRREI